MSNCPKCNAQYDEGAKFCISCGHNLQLTNNCDNCQKENPNGVNHCPEDKERIISEKPSEYQSAQNINPVYRYPKAALWPRFWAAVIDMLIGVSLTFVSFALLGEGFSSLSANESNYGDLESSALIKGLGIVMVFIFLLILSFLYMFIKDGLGMGQSYGKRIFGLMVVDIDNNFPCTKGKSSLRFLVSWLFTLIPLVNLITMWIEPIMVLANTDGRKFSDRAAHTQVIEVVHYNESRVK